MKLNDSNLFRQQALINGEWLDANNGEVIDVTNPANGDKLGSVPKMGADETRAAIDAAKATSDPAERMAAMHEAEDLIIGEDWALGPIYFYTQPYMLKSDVDGVFYTPLGYFFFQYASRG